MKAYETLTEATRRRIRKAHAKIKFIGFLYLLGILALAALAFLPAVQVDGMELSISTFYTPIADMFSGNLNILSLLVAFFYTCIILTVVINVFKAFGKLGRLFKKTARYVRLNRNLDAMEDLAAIYSGSFGAIVNFTFLICVIASFESILTFGYVTLGVGLLFHFLCGCYGGTISTFTSRASIEENKRTCGLFVYVVRNSLQVLAMVLISIFFVETSILNEYLVMILDGNIAALTSDIFVLAVFALQFLTVIWLLVMFKHATSATEFNVWGSEGPGMLNFRIFSFLSFITTLGVAIISLVLLKETLEIYKSSFYIAIICFIMFILDCVLKSFPREEEEEFEEPASTQKPPMWPPVICFNGANNPSTESKESSDVPNGLPEGLPPSELSSPREWQVVCPSCAAELKVKDGDYHRCPSCSKVFQVRKTKKAL